MRNQIFKIIPGMFAFLGLCSIALGQAAGAGQDKRTWRTLEFDQGGLTLSSPIELPLAEERKDKKGLVDRAYIGSPDEGLLLVKYSELPTDSNTWSDKDRINFYAGAWDGLAASFEQMFKQQGLSLKVKVTEKKEIRISDCPAWQISFAMDPLQGRFIITTAGRRAYIAAILASPEQYATLESQFFTSIKIKPGPISPGSNMR